MRGLQLFFLCLLAALSLASPTPVEHKFKRRDVVRREVTSPDYASTVEAAKNLAAAYSNNDVKPGPRRLDKRADTPASLAHQRAEALAAKYSENNLPVEAKPRIFRRRRNHP